MDEQLIDDVLLTPLKIIETTGGKVLHAMKKNEPGFEGFGEAYFSIVEHGAIKAWKRHKHMTLNLVVPVGEIRFVLYDDRAQSSTAFQFFDVTLSLENYMRLTIPPLIWVGFQGLSSNTNMLMNLSDIPHDPLESDRKQLDEIVYQW